MYEEKQTSGTKGSKSKRRPTITQWKGILKGRFVQGKSVFLGAANQPEAP